MPVIKLPPLDNDHANPARIYDYFRVCTVNGVIPEKEERCGVGDGCLG